MEYIIAVLKIPVYFEFNTVLPSDCCNVTQLASIYHLSTLIYLQFWLIIISLHCCCMLFKFSLANVHPEQVFYVIHWMI